MANVSFRQMTAYADGAPGATDRLLFETSGNAPRGCAPSSIVIPISSVTGLQTALDGKHADVLADNEKTASFTFALTDVEKMTRANHATVAITATVPPNSTVAFPLGSVLNVVQWGAAAVTIAQGAGVTINKPVTKTFVLAERYSTVTLWKQATDVWLLFGNLTDV